MYLHLDLPERTQVDRLMTSRSSASVSIYLPTDPAGKGEAERIELRNLFDEALRQLGEADQDKRERWPMEEFVAELLDDEALWVHLARSLAVFVTPTGITTFRLPSHLTSMVEVSDRFHLQPLLRALTFPSAAYVLAISTNATRVLAVLPAGDAVVVNVPGMPKDAVDAVGVPSGSGHQPHGRVQGGEGVKMRLGQYARAVDAALRPVLAGRTVPLVLSAARPVDDIYRQWNTYPHLVEEVIGGNPETTSDTELTAAARAIVDRVNAQSLVEVRELFAQRDSEGRGATDVAAVARAATFGMVDTVFVDIDAVVPGTVDDVTGAVEFAADDDAIAYGIVDEIARRTWLAGGRVLAVRREDIPGGGDVAAILRWALAT